MPGHFIERNSFGGFGVADDLPRVVVWNEAFRNDVEQCDGDKEEHAANQQGQGAMLERDLQSPTIATDEPFITALSRLPEFSMLERRNLWSTHIVSADRVGRRIAFSTMTKRFKNSATQHWSETERYKARNQNRDADRDCEFTEQTAKNTAEKQHRNEYRHQRNRHGYDRESDFARTFQSSFPRALSCFHAAHDVLEHYDGIVDDEADGQRQRHQREVVETEPEQVHDREGENDRRRQRQCRNESRAHVAQEKENDQNNQTDGEQQRELNVINRFANRFGTIVEHIKF